MPGIAEIAQSHTGTACRELQIGVIKTANPGTQFLFMCPTCHKLLLNGQEIALKDYTQKLIEAGRGGKVVIHNLQARDILGTAGFTF